MIQGVKYTEIDWVAYMQVEITASSLFDNFLKNAKIWTIWTICVQEVEGVLNGTYDYR